VPGACRRRLSGRTLIPLNGADSPSTYWLRFDDLPEGEYAVRILIERSDGEPLRAETLFHVV
jgi:hypothetical protein